MQELFRKYLDNQCSPEEVKELLAYFNNPENELLLRGLIAESLANSDEADDESQWQPATDKIFVQIKKQLKPKKGRVIPLFQKKLDSDSGRSDIAGGRLLGLSIHINSTGTVKPGNCKNRYCQLRNSPGWK